MGIYLHQNYRTHVHFSSPRCLDVCVTNTLKWYLLVLDWRTAPPWGGGGGSFLTWVSNDPDQGGEEYIYANIHSGGGDGISIHWGSYLTWVLNDPYQGAGEYIFINDYEWQNMELPSNLKWNMSWKSFFIYHYVKSTQITHSTWNHLNLGGWW